MKFWTDIYPAIEAAEAMLLSVDDDTSRLPQVVQVFLLVNNAQGVIDNGGYIYFFEADWDDKPPYDVFVTAYEAIGCDQQAADLRRVVSTFPFENPHLHREQRQAFIDARYDESKRCVPEWGEALCGDREVWEKLARYYELHEDAFA
jgi:hypothetical protein